LTWVGEPEEGIAWIEKAMRLNPYHPERFWNHLGRAYFVARRYADAISAFHRIATPDHFHCAFLAASEAALGDPSSARVHAAEVLRRDPTFSVDAYLRTLHYKRKEDADHHRDALLKAGLPALVLTTKSRGHAGAGLGSRVRFDSQSVFRVGRRTVAE